MIEFFNNMHATDCAQWVMIAGVGIISLIGCWRPKITTKRVVKEINDYQLKAGNMK